MLEDIYLGNTVRTWIIALAVVVVVTSVLVLLRRLVVRRLTVFARRTKTDIDDLIVELLGRTRVYFFLAVSLYGASHVLERTPEVQDILRILIILILLIQAGVWGNALVGYGLKRAMKTRDGGEAPNPSTMSALGFLIRLLLWSIVLLLALDNLDIDVTALVAGLGVGGIAVALAVQNILGDLFASLSIVLDKPFVIGDFVVVDALSGTVEHVGLKTTRIRSLSGEQIVISNADLLKSRIRNYKRMQERRVVFSVGVEYQTPVAKLEQIPGWLRDIVLVQPQARFDRAHLQAFGESAIMFEIVYYATNPDYTQYMNTQQEINLGIARRFEAEGVQFAFPTRTVYVRQKESVSKVAKRREQTRKKA